MTTLDLVLVLTITVYVSAQSCSGGPMTDALRKKMLDLHNEDRSSLAKGTADGSPRRAQNMYRLSWDCDLERQAQEWASGCKYKHSPDSWRQAGENLWTSFATVPLPINEQTMVGARTYWWKELVEHGIRNDDYKYSSNMAPIGHWTQMAWGNTTRVGCGVADCPWMRPGWEYNVYVVCQYRAPGNYRTRQVYEFGNGCSRDGDCTLFSGSTCDTNSQLCITPDDTNVNLPNPPPQPPVPTVRPPQPQPKPEVKCKATSMTQELRDLAVEIHNNGRHDLAMGLTKSKRKAKNVYKLSYDCKLENQAQAIADRCSFRSPDGASVFLERVNQQPEETSETLRSTLNKWWNYHKQLDMRSNIYDSNTLRQPRFFTQMVWGRTTKVGCAVNPDCKLNARRRTFRFSVTVCVYEEPGNQNGQPIYEYGTPCKDDSDCTTFPGSTCDTHWKLCVAP